MNKNTPDSKLLKTNGKKHNNLSRNQHNKKVSVPQLIEQYLKSETAKMRNTNKQQLKRVRNKQLVINEIDKRLLTSGNSKDKSNLLQLGVYIDRERYLLTYLNFLLAENIRINDMFFKRLEELPLSESEQAEMVKYIEKNSKFDDRVLEYISDANRDKALIIILEDAIKNGVRKKHLQILSHYKKEYIGKLQEEIRTEFFKNQSERKKLIKYFDLCDVRNQLILSEYYDLFQIYDELKKIQLIIVILNTLLSASHSRLFLIWTLHQMI